MDSSNKKTHDRGDRRAPGEVRDAIVATLRSNPKGASVREIQAAVETRLGKVAASSVRSYLQLGSASSPRLFTRVRRGQYRLARR